MMGRYATPAYGRCGEGLNLCLCTVQQAIERMFGTGGEGLNPLYMHGHRLGVGGEGQRIIDGDDKIQGCSTARTFVSCVFVDTAENGLFEVAL